MVGDGAPVLVRRALERAGLDPATPGALDRFMQIYGRRLLESHRPVSGCAESLALCVQRGPLAVLTNKPLGPSIGILEALGLRGFFSRIIGGDSEYGRKPDPAGLRALMALRRRPIVWWVIRRPMRRRRGRRLSVRLRALRFRCREVWRVAALHPVRGGSRPRPRRLLVDSTSIDEQLRRGARADRHARVVAAFEAHAVRHFVARLDLDGLTGLEVMALEEPQEGRILIGDARHGDARVQRAGQQRIERPLRKLALGGRNGIAVGIHFGMSQHVVDALHQPIRHDVLQLLRIVVDFVPAHAHHLHQEQLHQAMAPQHARGELFAG